MAKGSISTVDDLIKNDFVWAVGTAEEITAHQLGWWFMADYPLVTVSKRIQVRNIAHLAPKTEVSEYAQMMKLGDRFPPVIVTRDGFLVDGHTRTEAAKKLNWTMFPAFVLNVDYGSLDPDSPLRKTLLKLGAAQNNKHGRRMTAADIAGLIEQVAIGDTPKQIQRDMHVGASIANTVWNAARARAKAASLGITVSNELNNSMLKLFGGKSEKYTDPVWGRLFRLTQDARLSIPEVNEIMGRVEALHSEEDRVRLLETERVSHRAAISTASRVTPSHARRVNQGIGYLLRDDLTPDMLTERDPVQGGKYLRRLMDLEEKLRKIIRAQEQVEEARRTI
jgi:hypothetical protein